MKVFNNASRQSVFLECTKAMALPIVLISFGELATEIAQILTADVLGDFANAAFALDRSSCLQNIAVLVGCILLTVAIIPLISLIGNFVMLSKSLKHDRIIFDHFLQKRVQSVRQNDEGELQYQLEDAPNDLRIYFVRCVMQLIAVPVGWGYLLYSAGRIGWGLTAVIVVSSAIKLYAPILLRKKLADKEMEEKNYDATRRAYETEITQKPYMVTMWGLKCSLLTRLSWLYKAYYRETARQYTIYKTLMEYLPSILNLISSMTVFIIGAMMVAHRTITPGALVSMIAYMGITQTLLENIGEIIQNIPLLMNAVTRVCDFYDGEEDNEGVSIDGFKNLRVENVRFSYLDSQVLSFPCFEIHEGEKVKIVGKNGSGKSTLLMILCRIISNITGHIYINNVDIRKMNAEQWRKMLAYSSQEAFMFETTVRENISLDSSSSQVLDIDNYLDKFGVGYLSNRMISIDSGLSGGEKQKISIIRALLSNRPILMLDEPTNHLDQQSIEFLKTYLEETDKTVIIISHDHALDDVMTKIIDMDA